MVSAHTLLFLTTACVHLEAAEHKGVSKRNDTTVESHCGFIVRTTVTLTGMGQIVHATFTSRSRRLDVHSTGTAFLPNTTVRSPL